MQNEVWYTVGNQPCRKFSPADEWVFFPGNVRLCRRCDATVSFCKNCGHDHHFDGYETCIGRLEDIDAAREQTRAGLYDAYERLLAVRTWAMNAHLPGVSRWIFQTTGELSRIFSWLGTPIANTNSNSEEQRPSRITNSSSKEGESPPDSGEEPRTNTDSTPITKYEELAP